jgi:hypothetical protein
MMNEKERTFLHFSKTISTMTLLYHLIIVYFSGATSAVKKIIAEG